MKIRSLTLALVLAVAFCASAQAQTVNASQQTVLQGLRTSSAHGSFLAAAFAPDGSLILLLDEHDGVRLLKTDATGTLMLAQVQAGSTGDSGIAMALDPSGNVYITGTTTSSQLTGTSGSAFPTRADSSTNSFLAKYDKNLNLVFLTFLGVGRTAAAGVAATADAIFVTGITFNPAFPVTPAGIQQAPAIGSSENGFVERFTTNGSALVYATYLTGAKGNTVPTAIVADNADNAYIAGSTSTSGFPTIAALQPTILGTNSGFLTRLNAAGSAFVFSTFLAGNGITGLSLDTVTSSLLLTGNVALGQFPVATVAMPLTSASYQTLLRIPLAGQSITSSVLLVPGAQSLVTAAGDGSAWISGSLTTPLFPGAAPPDYTAGDSFLLHLTTADSVDQTLRFGGLAPDNVSYASLTSNVAAPTINAGNSIVMLPGTLTANVSSTLIAGQRFDFPLIATPNAILPSSVRDLIPTSLTCGASSQCSGTGAMLSSVSTIPPTTARLSLSIDDSPNLILYNLGSEGANGLSFSVNGFTLASNCSPTLAPSHRCEIALTGSGPGVITVSAANAPTISISLAANSRTPEPIVLDTGELDFGVVTSVDGTSTHSVTVTNLSSISQTFTSAQDSAATTYTFAETSSDCLSGGTSGVHILAANSSCHILLGLTISSSSSNDGPIRSAWKIGSRSLILTAFGQAAALNISASEVDFGTQFTGATSLNLPRYLYLSNNSNASIPHAAASLPSSSPFTVADNCPSSLPSHSVCQLKLSYLSSIAPSSDSITLRLDTPDSVVLTGTTLPPASVAGSATNPGLVVSATTLSFATPVAVTGLSTSPLSLNLKNSAANTLALSLAISGDFSFVSGCPAALLASASCTLQVVFKPSQPGLRSGLLSITSGSSFAPTYVALSGTASAILPPNNGTLTLGQTLVGEPTVIWYKLQQSLSSLTAVTAGPQFGVAIVQDAGSGHGTLPVSSFTQTATGSCTSCWLGLQFLSQLSGTQDASLVLSTTNGGSPYQLLLTATALPVEGLLLTPITPDFGPVPLNSSSAPMLFTFSNLFPSAVGVTIQSVTTSGDFTVAPNTSGGVMCGGPLADTATCFFQVVFSPTSAADRTGTLTVSTSAGTVTSTLTGYGTADSGLALNPSALLFSNVPGTAALQQSISVSNTGSSLLTLGTPTLSDPSFSASSSCLSLSPGSLCTLSITFSPQTFPTAGVLSLPVSTTLNGQTTTATYSVPLTGAYTSADAGLQILPNQVNFGSTATNDVGSTRQFTLNNLSGKALNMTFSMPRQFPLTETAPCTKLAVGASCNFSVTFLPMTGGPLTGSAFVFGVPTDGSASVQALTYLLGYGSASGQLTVSGGPIPNTPLSFGQVTSGQTVQHSLTLSNTGTVPITVHRITSQAPFLSTSNCGATMPVGGSCTATLTYAPTYELSSSSSTPGRSDTGTLVIESDAVSSPDSIPLIGSAVALASGNPASSATLSAFQLSESSLTFLNTQVGNTSPSKEVTLTNTGSVTLHIYSTITASDFTSSTTCTTVLPGAQCGLTVAFTPTGASTSIIRTGSLEILSDSGTSLEFISLIGTSSPSSLILSPIALDFGTVDIGHTGTLALFVTNNGASPAIVHSVDTSGDFSSSRGTCPANGSALAGNSSCTLNVVFSPTSLGTRVGSLSLSSDATQLPLQVALTGLAKSAKLTVTPGALAYGNIILGGMATLTVTLLNTGTDAVTGITNALSGVNPYDFGVVTPCALNVLAPGQGCIETVAFMPSLGGARSATLSIASSDPNSPLLVALSGTGLQSGSFTLTVNGATAASGTVKSGSPAVFPLVLTPQHGYTGNVALTCTPITPIPYASCSLLASTLALGGGPQTATATINTVTSGVVQSILGLSGLLLSPLILARKRRHRTFGIRLFGSGIVAVLMFSGCANGPTGGNGALRYTPPGSYEYQVTASSTSGTVLSSTVTLNVVVQ